MGKILDHAEIGDKIRKFRLQAGFTQERLAEELEITYQQVQKYERGVTKVNLTKLQQIAIILNVPIVTFFQCDCGETMFLSNEEKNLVYAFRNIKKPSLRGGVLEIVATLAEK